MRSSIREMRLFEERLILSKQIQKKNKNKNSTIEIYDSLRKHRRQLECTAQTMPSLTSWSTAAKP